MAVTTYGQVEYNSVLLPSSVYEIQSIEGLADFPDVRVSDATLLSRHGVHAGNDLLGGRKITLVVAIHASTAAAFATAVTAFRTGFMLAPNVALTGDLPLTFRFPGLADNGNAFINCRPRRLAMSMTTQWNNGFATTATVELFANDPVVYGATQHNSSFSVNGGSAACTNAGNWPSLYRIDLAVSSGPLLNATVQNGNLAVLKHLTLAASYASGDAISIIPPQRRVVLDPVGAPPPEERYHNLSDDSQWFELVPGVEHHSGQPVERQCHGHCVLVRFVVMTVAGQPQDHPMIDTAHSEGWVLLECPLCPDRMALLWDRPVPRMEYLFDAVHAEGVVHSWMGYFK